MGFENYISETEAASLAGVSVKTLSRFAEAGYLQIESDSDGLRLFSKRELGEVFGITESLLSFTTDIEGIENTTARPDEKDLSTSEPVEEIAASEEEADEEVVDVPEPVEDTVVDEETVVEEQELQSAPELQEAVVFAKEASPESYYGEPAAKSAAAPAEDLFTEEKGDDAEENQGECAAADMSDSEIVEEPVARAAEENLVQVEEVEPLSLGVDDLDFFKRAAQKIQQDKARQQKEEQVQTAQAGRSPAADQEIVRLQNIVNLQEKLLDSRDAEIADLHKQRDWLQTRVERLEDKSERDQLLLLSETQLLRQTLLYQQKKSSVFKGALEWLGLLPAPNESNGPGGTIEVGGRKREGEGK